MDRVLYTLQFLLGTQIHESYVRLFIKNESYQVTNATVTLNLNTLLNDGMNKQQYIIHLKHKKYILYRIKDLETNIHILHNTKYTLIFCSPNVILLDQIFSL